MRVVAGHLGGRRLATPPTGATRPTSGKVRGAIFNSLEARGVVDGAVVVDLFAGSGALGIEALSRGADRATFVEQDRRAAGVIRDNLAVLGLLDRGRVEVGDAERWVAGAGRPADPTPDLVLADPPYGYGGWTVLLAGLASLPAVLVVAEADHPVTADGWEVLVARRHGGTVVSQLRPRGATAQ
jgi:16S rRNA (guanine966-N2)-methyltransferase